MAKMAACIGEKHQRSSGKICENIFALRAASIA
jgi:hypothetical protein